ncbi:MAG: antibiotic resistance protein [Betaproteobacteria bacterium]|nr:antibiotic resistance protein [Betaproteobacteria bacterium]
MKRYDAWSADSGGRQRKAHPVQHTRLTRISRRACAFAGPSLGRHSAPPGIDLLPPAARGALAAAVRAGYTRIGFIDGAVENASRLPLRELREVLATPGVEVLGGASMGAIRAAQLESAGMRGVGHVFRLFRRGSLVDSDEVYVLHAPAALHYRCLTLPLVNVRYTLRSMRRSGHLAPADERAIMQYMRGVPWFDRDRHSLSAAVYAVCGRLRCARVIQAFDCLYRDIKRDDALSLLSMLHRRFAFREMRRAIQCWTRTK